MITCSAVALYPENQVVAVIEYDVNKLLLAVNDMDHLIMFDAVTKQQITTIKNPTATKTYLSMKKVPGFDIDTNPLVILKDSLSISVVNVVNKKIVAIVPCIF